MFAYDNATSPHGVTKGVDSAPVSASFSRTEGPEKANQLCHTIKITLGRLNALPSLTTPLEHIIAQIPTSRTESARFKSYEMEEKIMERWNKAYWTVRGFFKPGSPAAEQLIICDETADLPEL